MQLLVRSNFSQLVNTSNRLDQEYSYKFVEELESYFYQ